MNQAAVPIKQRINSIDILRGAIMLIMAIDHTRDFFNFSGPQFDPTNMSTTTPLLFFTRWITHFCAPGFVLLCGMSAYIAGLKRSKSELRAFLIKRGFWLILIEIFVLTFALTLNPFYNVIILQVLWVIGFSMIILGLLVRAPLWMIAVIGGSIFFGHDMIDYMQLPKSGSEFDLLSLFFTAFGSDLPVNKTHIVFDLYAVIPWTGVMLIGYVFGSLYKPSFDVTRRRKILLYSGLATTLFFIIVRFINHYGDPAPWSVQRNGAHTFLSFLNVSKYPPSLMYSCMTLGPALIILALTERVQNKVTAILIVYGNVPFFYYILHFYLLRIINIVLFFASGYTTKQIVNPKSFFIFKPPGFGYSLGGVYLIWLFVVVALYLPCKWYGKYKKTHNQWWLSYL